MGMTTLTDRWLDLYAAMSLKADRFSDAYLERLVRIGEYLIRRRQR